MQVVMKQTAMHELDRFGLLIELDIAKIDSEQIPDQATTQLTTPEALEKTADIVPKAPDLSGTSTPWGRGSFGPDRIRVSISKMEYGKKGFVIDFIYCWKTINMVESIDLLCENGRFLWMFKSNWILEENKPKIWSYSSPRNPSGETPVFFLDRASMAAHRKDRNQALRGGREKVSCDRL